MFKKDNAGHYLDTRRIINGSDGIFYASNHVITTIIILDLLPLEIKFNLIEKS